MQEHLKYTSFRIYLKKITQFNCITFVIVHLTKYLLLCNLRELYQVIVSDIFLFNLSLEYTTRLTFTYISQNLLVYILYYHYYD